jgi:3'-5' exoribonuclease
MATINTELGSLENTQWVSGTYCFGNPQVGTTRQGKSFLKCLLRDATGEVQGRMWSFDQHRLKELARTGFVRIEGSAENFNDHIQLKIESIEAVDVTESDMQQLLPSTEHDIEAMFSHVTTLLHSMSHPAMRSLANAYLGDEELMARFRMAPAAMAMHHAWIGGLLEHTHQLMCIADAIVPLYRGAIDRDLVLMGLFIHDLGKTIELTWQKGFDYTTEGNLVGHIARGAMWLEAKAESCDPPLPGESLRVLQNIILSHHGEPEYGALRPPSTPEAILVSQLDNLDAKTQMAITAVQQPGAVGGAFTDKIWGLNSSRLYRPRPLDAGREAHDEDAIDATSLF